MFVYCCSIYKYGRAQYTFMRKGMEMAINATVKWVLALIIVLIIIMFVLALRDRSIALMLSTLKIPV